jgi:hypothetical protein
MDKILIRITYDDPILQRAKYGQRSQKNTYEIHRKCFFFLWAQQGLNL